MKNVRLTWLWPTTRADGTPLDRAEILGADVELSADGGASFVLLGNLPADSATPSFLQTELEPGEWTFRVTVIDRQTPPERSAPATVVANIKAAAPGAVVNLAVEIL